MKKTGSQQKRTTSPKKQGTGISGPETYRLSIFRHWLPIAALIGLIITSCAVPVQAAGTTEEVFYGQRYELSQEELRSITAMCLAENGKRGIRVEASQMLNLYEYEGGGTRYVQKNRAAVVKWVGDETMSVIRSLGGEEIEDNDVYISGDVTFRSPEGIMQGITELGAEDADVIVLAAAKDDSVTTWQIEESIYAIQNAVSTGTMLVIIRPFGVNTGDAYDDTFCYISDTWDNIVYEDWKSVDGEGTDAGPVTALQLASASLVSYAGGNVTIPVTENQSDVISGDAFYNYIEYGGWYATSAAYGHSGSYWEHYTTLTQDDLMDVYDVVTNGNRVLPYYVTTHDSMSDIAWKSTDDWIPGVTVYRNVYGGTHIFYGFPNGVSDPFGYDG